MLVLLALAACHGPEAEPSPVLDVDQTEEWHLPGLRTRAYVVRTEGNMPHVYATNRQDLARVLGFTLARDRFFMMDLAGRLGSGEVSGLLGDAALETDQEARGNSMRHVTDGMLASLSAEQLAVVEAYAEGVNAYIQEVRDGNLPPPSEYEQLHVILGGAEPVDIMEAFTPRRVIGAATVVVFESSFETGDVGRAAGYAQLDGHFDGDPLATERQAGLYDEVWGDLSPVLPGITSAEGFDPPTSARRRSPSGRPDTSWIKVPAEVLTRTFERGRAFQERLGQNWEIGWGSNVWAVSRDGTGDGSALLAADGHLPLTVPSLFAEVHLDTAELGGGTITQHGLMVPGTPMIAFGTNGHIAWGQTQLMGDVNDWYQEQIQLDDQGYPKETLYQGHWLPLERIEETYEIADLPALGSVGRTEAWARWTTWDGRFVMDVEGREARPGDALADGEALINVRGLYVVPGDLNDDGVITALTFDYTGLDGFNLIDPFDGFAASRSVEEFAENAHGLVATSFNHVAADSSGSIFYTGYQAVPCRGYLPRNADRTWVTGADPTLLLDGTRYAGFTIPLLPNGRVDESQSADPVTCVVPFDAYPHEQDPERGFVVNTNTDPGNVLTDGDLYDDTWYIGGPWMEGYRHQTVNTVISEAIADGGATLDTMRALQSDHRSPIGADFSRELLRAIDRAQALSAARAVPAGPDQRIVALYDADSARIDEVHTRITAWLAAGAPARSGVETFYSPVLEGDLDAAVATTLYNTWYGHYRGMVLDDEGFPGGWKRPTGGTGELRLLQLMLGGRGEGNPLGLGSWSDVNDESAYFDIRSTEVVERSDEVALLALQAALDYLTTAPTSPGRGGFGTADMSAWLWGLRHYVEMNSLIGSFLGNTGPLGGIASDYAITPARFPIAEGLSPSDPRASLPGFPTHGDNEAVAAADPGFGGRDFSYDSGSVYRYVWRLTDDGVEGSVVIPGGQSGLVDSAFFDDQAKLWLGYEYLPARFTVADVVAGATGRETFIPAH